MNTMVKPFPQGYLIMNCSLENVKANDMFMEGEVTLAIKPTG